MRLRTSGATLTRHQSNSFTFVPYLPMKRTRRRTFISSVSVRKKHETSSSSEEDQHSPDFRVTRSIYQRISRRFRRRRRPSQSSGPDSISPSFDDTASVSDAISGDEAASLRNHVSRSMFDAREEEEIVPRQLLPYLPYVEKTVDTNSRPPFWSTKVFDPVKTVKNWLQTCDRQHRGHAGCSFESQTLDGPWSGPLLLIDVVNNCLVPTPTDATSYRYVALSYTWGNSHALSTCTTTHNFSSFREPGGLIAAEETLPSTVRDTVEFVRKIGERYLWVDRFCIVQDMIVGKQSQLDAMGKIYARSYLTIIAAQSEDTFGPLYNPNPIDRALTHSSPLPLLSGAQTLVGEAHSLMWSTWYSRAWTFQEYLFSKRKIVFHNDTVNWECGISAWHETQEVSTTTIPALRSEHNHIRSASKNHLNDNSTGFDFPPWPDMNRYARLVALFNDRNLTFPEDVMDAFAGVLSHLSHVFPGGFITGLPVMCFDAALLWQPFSPVRRRQSLRRPIPESTLPSWSWAGWAGNLNSQAWRSAANYQFEGDRTYSVDQCSWKTTSTVEWSYSLTLESPKKPIKPSIQYLDRPANPETLIMNKAWSWVQEPKGDYVFYHSNFPMQPFRYPVPIRDQHKAHIPPINARYLHGTTVRASLRLGSLYWNDTSKCMVLELRTTEDKWAGMLRLNVSKYHADRIYDSEEEREFPSVYDREHNMSSSSGGKNESGFYSKVSDYENKGYSITNKYGSDVSEEEIEYNSGDRRERDVVSSSGGKDESGSYNGGSEYGSERYSITGPCGSDVERYNRSETVQLVEISAGSVRDQDIEEQSFDEWQQEGCPRRDGIYEFVNVLWVDWKEGVAYRKVLGRVEKGVWDSLEKETIELTLG
ncbi:unnamed protein product [Periconia digitata]|uniref:Heterokaryon incompatibility domain-containing protein n=1 Tax=Periconia digitata TaxID=1303443 RepID=A0A9W4XUM1_9PLEO|nr:unnamed protein product [Periconia digitata]